MNFKTLELDYKMDHPGRGKAIIFNHYEFQLTEMIKRQGTHLDEDYFVDVLKTWGFQKDNIEISHDFPLKEIKEKLQALSKVDYSDYDVFLCAIFTHGERNALYSFDTLFATSKMWQYFTDDKCPSLKGKPKLFFIQACRGDKIDPGLKVRDPKQKTAPENDGNIKNDGNIHSFDSLDFCSSSQLEDENEKPECKGSTQSIPASWLENAIDSSHDFNPNLFRKSSDVNSNKQARSFLKHTRCEIPDTLSENQNYSSSFSIDNFFQVPHDDPDILVAYSTADGYYSFRNPALGSWFISTLHKVVKETKDDHFDLLQLLTEVNLRVAVDKEANVTDKKSERKKFHKKKQAPCFHSTLTKRLYFR